MKTLLRAGLALAGAAVAVSGCAGLPGVAGGASTKDFLQHMEQCDRHYEGAVGGPAVNASFKIDCKAQLPASATATPPL